MIDLSKNGNGEEPEDEPQSPGMRITMLTAALEDAVDGCAEALGNLTCGEIIGALEIYNYGVLRESYAESDDEDDEGDEWKK